MRVIYYVVLAATLLSSQGERQGPKKAGGTMDSITFAKNVGLAKGGIGIIRRDDLYIALKADKNTLLLSGDDKWTGLSAPIPEVAIFFENKVWSPQSLPNGFDLSRAVVISFETDKVRFFDFAVMSGGYYKRRGQN